MKKLTAYVCAAVLITASLHMSLPTVYAMTKVNNAQTAVESSMDELLTSLDKADINESFTREDLENLIFEACNYTVDGRVGVGFMVDKFRIVSPTGGNAGYMSADVIIYLDDAEEAYSVKKEFSSSGGLSINDGNDDSDSTGNTSNENTAEAKKSIAAAKSAINAAIWEFEVSNNTTADDILNMAKAAVESGVTVTLDKSDFKLVKASTTIEGTVSATLTLDCGGISDRVPVAKTIPVEVTETSTAIDQDRKLMGVAVGEVVFTNRTNAEEILAAAKKAVKNGSEVSVKSFSKKKATFEENGEITCYLTMTLGNEERETRISEKITQLERNMPTDKISVNKEEWEILRLTNVEREKVGVPLLTMIEQLQNACDTRAVELAEKFSHERPNGQPPFTAIQDFTAPSEGENIYRCDAPSMAVSAKRAMNSWMNSDGHRAAIQNGGYSYIGTGAYDDEKYGTAVQLFASVQYRLVSAVTASGKTNYIDEDELQKDYLICTASNDQISYVPLDISYMRKTDEGYTLNLRIDEPIVLTVGNTAGNTAKAETEKDIKASIPFVDVKATDYFAEAVGWAVKNSITAGTSETTFSPEQTCTRAQILTFLWRAVGSPKASTDNPFTDISADAYYYDAAIWAYNKGMVSGNRFEGDTPCTRASTVEYLWKNADSPQNTASNSFEDVSADSDYAQAVSWAVENGVTTGTSDTAFSPDTICSRGQIVTFLNRAIKKI